MRFKRIFRLIHLPVVIYIIVLSNFLFAIGNATENLVSPLQSSKLTGNVYCLGCHGNLYYSFKNNETGKVRRKMMSFNCVIDTNVFKKSNHRNFKCTSCHSNEFYKFPHSEKALSEEIGTCVECHSGDSVATAYKFDLIESDFQKSVHAKKLGENFTCWLCHEPHSYKVNSTSIEYANSMCLSCHANTKKYNLIIAKNKPNIIEKHDWLPNQQIHFQNVRCIECHAKVNDSILVAHNIQPKSYAVKLCVECHSTNSILLQTLYKYQSKEQISKNGFLNAVILNKSYVIGANRNYFLNKASIIILIIVLIIIAIHLILRFLLNKK